jgi:DNA-binding transcriptional MerR regulator/effector-binding domain-containing protein
MEKNLTISEMSRIHCISRQTLIYYDKIGLFKPICTNKNGYRYYSPTQIPFLREICFLKSIGINLKDIKHHIENRNLSSAISLLKYHERLIDGEIGKLLHTREAITHRLRIYDDASTSEEELYKPVLKFFPKRKVVFLPFQNKICREELHLTIMRILAGHDCLISDGFGTILLRDRLDQDDRFYGAGSYIALLFPDIEMENSLLLPEGEYACMYKYAMPYETRYLDKLLNWISGHQYQVCGNVVDACLLDTTFYNKNETEDFCELQIPIKKAPLSETGRVAGAAAKMRDLAENIQIS